MDRSWSLFFLFSSFSHSNIKYSFNFNIINWKKHRWCAWDSNPERRMVGADETSELSCLPLLLFLCQKFKELKLTNLDKSFSHPNFFHQKMWRVKFYQKFEKKDSLLSLSLLLSSLWGLCPHEDKISVFWRELKFWVFGREHRFCGYEMRLTFWRSFVWIPALYTG